MLKILFGLFLLVLPFVLLTKFKDKKLGFAYILSFVIFFHLIVALVTQALHMFTYGLILFINILASLYILKINFRDIINFRRSIFRIKINWIFILIFAILFIQFYSIHYNYTGKITVAVDPVYREVQNMKYPYPYFADEWYAVALIKDSIKSSSLPINNPYDKIKPFLNFELAFHSFLSGIILLLGLDPVTQYTVIAIFTGMLICLLVYLFLRYNNVRKLPAAITCLSIPYIVNSANLPGVWHLIPITMGVILFLLGLFFISGNEKKMALFMLFPISIFYPPLFLFYSLSLLSFILFSNSFKKKEKLNLVFYYLLIVSFIVIFLFFFIFLFKGTFSGTINLIISKIFFEALIKDSVPQLSLFVVIPTLI